MAPVREPTTSMKFSASDGRRRAWHAVNRKLAVIADGTIRRLHNGFHQSAGVHASDTHPRLITRYRHQPHLDRCWSHANQDIAAGGRVVHEPLLYGDLREEVIDIRIWIVGAGEHRDLSRHGIAATEPIDISGIASPDHSNQDLRKKIAVFRQIGS